MRPVCTAPIGKYLFDINPDFIANIEEINNDYSAVLFTVKLPTRTSRTRHVTVPTFGICDSQGKIVTFGMATPSLLRGALMRVERSAGSLANKMLFK